jgi:hypothetical protein
VRRLTPPLACALLAVASPAGAAPRGYEVGPAPAWVSPLPLPMPAARGADQEGGGVEYLLVDDQIRAAPPLERHRHVVMEVTSTAGVENASELRIDFDPSYERLVLHGAWVVRGGHRVAVLGAADIRVIQRETDLDRRLLDGTLTAVIFLPDVRVGDVIEYAYTRRGANPVLGGRQVASLWLAWGAPVHRARVRLLWPAHRPLHHRVSGLELAPAIARRGDTTEYVWERTDVPAAQGEDGLPPDANPWPALELSEFASWGEVVAWALPLYPDAPLSPAMRAKVATWRELPTPAARARAALGFVEDEVRYLGIELGERSHRPRPPAEVFSRRFGDCKDKAYLLVTLLRALGVEAVPALVSTGRWGAVADHLPSPYQFDHVIVRARVDGVIRWLEPTRSLERAPLEALVPPVYGVALPIAAGAGALEPLPDRVAARTTAVTTLRVNQFGAPAALEVETAFEGLRAVGMRHRIADQGLRALQRDYLEHYASAYPGIRVDGPVEIEDAPDRDRLVVHERYTLPAVTRGAELEFAADMVREELEAPEVTLRRFPLRVRHPAVVHEEIRIQLPGTPDYDPEDDEVSGPAARLSHRLRVAGQEVVDVYELRTLADTVPVDRLERHLAALREMRKLSAYTAKLAVRPAATAARGRATAPEGEGGGVSWTLLLLLLGAVGLAVAFMNGTLDDVPGLLVRLRQGRRRRAFAALFAGRPGDSPALPLLVAHAGDLPRQLARLRCACGGALDPTPREPSEMTFGGRPVRSAVFSCGTCPQGRRIYFSG